MTEGIKKINDDYMKKLEEDQAADKARKPEEVEAAVKGILTRAIEFLTPRQLVKEVYFTDKEGKFVTFQDAKEKAANCCTAGALIAANGFEYGFDYGRATNALRTALQLEVPHYSVMSWNDRPETTKEMALEGLKKALAEYKYAG